MSFGVIIFRSNEVKERFRVLCLRSLWRESTTYTNRLGFASTTDSAPLEARWLEGGEEREEEEGGATSRGAVSVQTIILTKRKRN
jgi:hypothetical protein